MVGRQHDSNADTAAGSASHLPPCEICGSTDHSTSHHHGVSPEECDNSQLGAADEIGSVQGPPSLLSHADDSVHAADHDPPRSPGTDIGAGWSKEQPERLTNWISGGDESGKVFQDALKNAITHKLLWPTAAINTSHFGGESMSTGVALPVAIYVSDETAYVAVEAALLDLLAALDIDVIAQGEPKIGSMSRWFEARRRRRGVDALDMARRALEMQVLEKEQANIDSLQADAVAKLLSSLDGTDNALVQIGSVLLMKVDGGIVVRNLSQQEMILIHRKSTDLATPRLILEALEEFACKRVH